MSKRAINFNAETQWRNAKTPISLCRCVSALIIVIVFSACSTTPAPTTTATAEPTTAIQPTAASTLSPAPPLPSPPAFYFGADMSYANEMGDCGSVYRVNGESQDPFTILAERGTNLIRARLWHNPDWTDYSTTADVQKTFQRAKAAGLFTLLSIHYSDEWADPAKQYIPAAWIDIEDSAELAQAVYDYTYDTLLTLHENDALPDFVQVGNETNGGLLKESVGVDWPRDAQLFNAGIRATRDLTAELGHGPQILLHVAQPENTGWWFREATAAGITDFDIIGISYYPQWSRMSLPQLGGQINYLRQTFGKEVMVVETAYPWTVNSAVESADNILNQGLRHYGISPEGQHDFMVDLAQTLINSGALGAVYWEPAWVSTDCTTRWGQGSHWENAAFFDFENDNELLPVATYPQAPYTTPSRLIEGAVDDTVYGEPLLTDAAADSQQDAAHLDLDALYVSDEDDYYTFALTINGDIAAQQWGDFLLYIDTDETGGANVDVRERPISVTAEHLPEFRLDFGVVEENGTLSADFILNAWNGTEWEDIPFTGGTALRSGTPSIIEWQLPKALLHDTGTIWVALVSVGRGRNQGAADILGSEPSPTAWDEPVMLSTFAQYESLHPES